MGRKPLSAAEKLRRGNPGKRPVIDNAPKPQAYDGEIPYWLTENAKQIWAEYVDSLLNNGYLSDVDVPIFGMWCEAFARYLWLTHQLDQLDQEITISPTGIVRPHPYLAQRTQAAKELVKITSEIGMSPTSRTKVNKVGEKGGGESRFTPPKLVNG